MMKIKLRWKEIQIVVCIYFCRILAVIFPQKHWVICERGTDARDNGYWFYRYLKENHPEQKVYYIIDRWSADYDKVKADAVKLGSLKNYWVVASAGKRISTHYGSGLPVFSPKIFRFCGLHRNFYFLQHGITKNDLVGLYRRNAPMELFVCGAKPEYDYILENYGHSDQVVRYTGLARFDQLHHVRTKKQILVMPTWRMYIRSRDAFLESDYFACWQSFLENKALNDQLEREDMKLVFYVHYEMQKFLDCFCSPSERIVLAKFDDYDVQTLLKESAVLVTDYSSVFFDFAYMRKPVVYYQFDEEAFHGRHYQKGYFDYRQMGFGDVTNQEKEAVESLLQICQKDMQIKAEYLERIERFFPLCDTNNCKRIYEWIAKDQNEK